MVQESRKERMTGLIIAVPAAFHAARELPRHVNRASTVAGREARPWARPERHDQRKLSESHSHNKTKHTPTLSSNSQHELPTTRERAFIDRVNDLDIEASFEAWDRGLEKYIEEQEEIEASYEAHLRSGE